MTGDVNMFPVCMALLYDKKDKNKIELLYVSYRKLMFHVANCILCDEWLAEDAVHQTFLRIIENFNKLGEFSCHKTKSYIVTMARNIAINFYNQRKRNTTIPLENVEYCIKTEPISDTVLECILVLAHLYKYLAISTLPLQDDLNLRSPDISKGIQHIRCLKKIFTHMRSFYNCQTKYKNPKIENIRKGKGDNNENCKNILYCVDSCFCHNCGFVC